jgi:hypothetical protein
LDDYWDEEEGAWKAMDEEDEEDKFAQAREWWWRWR